MVTEKGAGFESRRMAVEQSYTKAVMALSDVNQVAHDFLTATERDLVDFVKTMLVRKLPVEHEEKE